MGKVYQFSSPQYPQLQIGGVEPDKAGKGGKPSTAFENGVLSTDDEAVAARVREVMAHDPSLGIVDGAAMPAEVADESGPSAPSLNEMNKAELVAMAEGMGLDSSGTNAEVRDRITEAQDANPPADMPPQAQPIE